MTKLFIKTLSDNELKANVDAALAAGKSIYFRRARPWTADDKRREWQSTRPKKVDDGILEWQAWVRAACRRHLKGWRAFNYQVQHYV